MPVLTKIEHDNFVGQLEKRYEALRTAIIIFPSSEASKKRQIGICTMYETAGGPTDIRIAVEDFKTILAELKRLK